MQRHQYRIISASLCSPPAVKIVLKGDRNTGKTCLFHRMGGKGFMEAYLPTSEIQVSPFQFRLAHISSGQVQFMTHLMWVSCTC